ncbi:MAG: SPOR domain-containing protein, partial [Balneolaceae bacterium]|nr:SPOR domain-containing protein [Balneolaceae bacterium]
EMGYLTYQQQKQMYGQYPAMFPDSLRRDLRQRYRNRESFSVVAHGSHEDDNFNNRVTRLGIGAEWGNTTRNVHSLNFSRLLVESTVNDRDLFGRLYQADYSFAHTFPNQQMQARAGGGVQYRSGDAFPYAAAGISHYDSLSFSSLELQFQPVLTNTGIDRGIKELEGTLYREDTWLNGLLRTAISGRGRYFTDNVLAYKGGVSLYLWPQTVGDFSITPVVSGSYGHASVSRLSGVPYYTPSNLITRGAGLNLAYQVPQSDISIQMQLQANRDNDTGLFSSANTTVSTPLGSAFALELQGNISNSQVYRSNSISFSLKYNFPKRLTPQERGGEFRRGPAGRNSFNGSSGIAGSGSSAAGASGDGITNPYKILGTVTYPDTAAYTSLYRHTVAYEKIGGRNEGIVHTYFTGDFLIDNLPPGRYKVWIADTRGNREIREIRPDTLEIVLDERLEFKADTSAAFTLHPGGPEPEEPAIDDSLQHYVVINYSDTLSQALSLIERDQPALRESLSLYYDQRKGLIQIGSTLYSGREQAEQFYRRYLEITGNTPFGIQTVAPGDTAVTEMSYRYQFGSFKNYQNAQKFVEVLDDNISLFKIEIAVDPILGLFEIVTAPGYDWLQSERDLQALEAIVGEDEVFRDVQPAFGL